MLPTMILCLPPSPLEIFYGFCRWESPDDQRQLTNLLLKEESWTFLNNAVWLTDLGIRSEEVDNKWFFRPSFFIWGLVWNCILSRWNTEKYLRNNRKGGRIWRRKLSQEQTTDQMKFQSDSWSLSIWKGKEWAHFRLPKESFLVLTDSILEPGSSTGRVLVLSCTFLTDFWGLSSKALPDSC